jgi:hypothetical protein
MVTAEQLTATVKVATAPASGSQAQPLILHTGRAAVAAGEKVSLQLGRVVELNRGSMNLGALHDLVDRWNLADLTDATLGVGKDGKAKLDPRGRRSTVQHFGRLKQATKEFDNAWHDANNNVLVRYLYRNLNFYLYLCRFQTLQRIDISSQSPSFGLSTQYLARNFLKKPA